MRPTAGTHIDRTVITAPACPLRYLSARVPTHASTLCARVVTFAQRHGPRQPSSAPRLTAHCTSRTSWPAGSTSLRAPRGGPAPSPRPATAAVPVRRPSSRSPTCPPSTCVPHTKRAAPECEESVRSVSSVHGSATKVCGPAFHTARAPAAGHVCRRPCREGPPRAPSPVPHICRTRCSRTEVSSAPAELGNTERRCTVWVRAPASVGPCTTRAQVSTPCRHRPRPLLRPGSWGPPRRTR